MRNLIQIFLCFALIYVTTGEVIDTSWWQTASFYKIYPRSFKDSNGDGIGDIKGITQQLSYLKEISVDAAWLSPVFTSPMADSDISNFQEIDPVFGTMADFDELIEKSKEIGVKIILDFVPNHTSDEHEWFIKSAKNDPEYADFYVWHPGKIDANGTRIPPTNWIAVYRGSMWTWHEERQAYYLHQFHYKQPDLNYDNPKVGEAIKNVLRFWLRKGVAGFNVVAVPHIYEVARDADGNWPDEPHYLWEHNPEDYNYLEHIYTTNQPGSVELLYEFRQVMNELDDELGAYQHILMTEAYADIEFDMLMTYYGNRYVDGVHIPFISDLSNLYMESSAFHYTSLIAQFWLDIMPAGRTANFVLGSHDQKRIGTRLGADRIDMINILLKTLPGASVTYQGDEIGMTDVSISWDHTVDPIACQSNPNDYERLSRDPERTPFQWNDGLQAGFTDNETIWLPLHADYKTVNLKSERGIPFSHLNIYKQLQSLRHEKVMRYGPAEVTTLNINVLAIKRSLPGEPTYLVVLNLKDGYEKVNPKKEFPDLSTELTCVLTTDKSIRRKGDIVRSSRIELLPKEALILITN